ncbi:MAG: hypothetical protein ACI35R_05750 [Bacillus sp. (in: firmicutes)]
MSKKNYHCCATCIHFKIGKANNQIAYRCSRLGFETKTRYQFNCWQPREDIMKRMNR